MTTISSISSLQPIPASDGVPRYNGPTPYIGLSPGYLIENHVLAHQIIACHPDPNQKVLDLPSLELLRRYVNAPEEAERLLKEVDMWDEDGKKGERANKKYECLVGYVIATRKLTEKEVLLLKEWFTGDVASELEGVELKKTVIENWKGD